MAVAAALIIAGICLFVWIGHKSSRRTQPLPGDVVQDIGAPPPKPPGESLDAVAGVPASGAARLQFTDKTDPTRLQSELSFDKLDPAGGGYYTLDQPRAWLYFKDGRTMHVSAKSGRVKMVGKSQQPESGDFTGGVIVKVFAPLTPDQLSHAIDPDHDAPALLATTQNVSFDTALLELSTDDPVTVSTPAMLFQGRGLLVRGNEVKQRLELFKTSGQFIRFNPKVASDHKPDKAKSVTPAIAANPSPATTGSGASNAQEAAASTSTGDSSTGTSTVALAGPPAPPPPTVPPRETLYKAIASTDVKLIQTGRTLNADTLELWARTLNNRLPDNAFAPIEFAQSGQPSAAPAKPTGADPAKTQTAVAGPVVPLPPPPASTGLFISAGNDDIVLSWSGPLIVTPVQPTATNADPVPEQLAAGNHFAARFSAERPGGESAVHLVDAQTGVNGTCAALEYRATTRDLRLSSGVTVKTVDLISPDAGSLSVPNISMNIGSGISHVDGGGTLVSMRALPGSTPATSAPAAPPPAAGSNAPLDPAQLRRITWTEQADYQFRVTDGKLVGAVDSAAFTGNVLARDHASVITGDFLQASFAKGVKQPMVLKSLKVRGHVLAVGGTGTADPRAAGPTIDPFVAADNLDVAFVPGKVDPDEAEPSVALASGAARVGDRDSTLSAARIETRMGHDDKNALIATDVLASPTTPGAGDVRFERRMSAGGDVLVALADRIRADARAQTAELTGSNVTLSRGPSAIRGTKVRLDENKGTLIVDGPGTFEHEQPSESSPQLADASGSGSLPALQPGTHILTTWQKGMAFDNKRGEITCEGQTVVTSNSAFASDTLKSEKLVLNITPDAEGTSLASLASPAATSVTSTATTTPLSTAAAPPAPPSNERKLLRVDAIGSIVSRADGKNATVEARRYAPPPPMMTVPAEAPEPPTERDASKSRVLEEVIYIEGPRIMTDETTGMMVVPAAGRAVVRDQRAGPAQELPAKDASGMPSTTSRGTSGFTWAQSMDFNRFTGVITMRKDVELVHVSLDDTQKTRLVAAELIATLAAQQRGTGATAPRNQKSNLLHAEATGAVYAESGSMKLVTDRFSYDAVGATAEAQAEPGNRVTLYDDRKPTPVVARKLFWDLARDRVEISEPAPMVAPR